MKRMSSSPLLMRAARGCLALSAAVFALSASNARADIVTFDFDTLAPWIDEDAAISAAMTSVYGSTVTSYGGRAGAGLGFGSDPYIFADLAAGGMFFVSFEESPILAARFLGHVFYPTGRVDFEFRAYRHGELVTSFTRNNAIETFDSGWIYFGGQEVDLLRFSNNFVHAIGVDNLTVQGVDMTPTPGAAVLGAVGLMCLCWVRRRAG
jgi:hypothetical protein